MGWTGSTWLRGGPSGLWRTRSGPYMVFERGNKAWKLQVGERVHVVSRDGLKPHLGSMAPEAAVPPTCGRSRTASVAPVAFTSSAEKPGGPV